MDFSVREKNIWIELILNAAISAYYFISIYQLSRWTEINGQEVGELIFEVITFAILGSIILHFIFIRNKCEEKKDERDISINAKANAVGYYTLVSLCCLLISHIMMNEGAGYFFPDRTTPISGPFAMHLILLALIISSFAKSITQIFYYRRGY